MFKRLLRLRVILYLLLCLIFVDRLVWSQRRLWRSYDPDEYRERLRDCERETYDVVLVGGSPVCEGLDPALLAGMSWRGSCANRVYNLGLPGGTTTEVWYAVKHALKSQPKLVIYGITATDLNDGRAEPHGPGTLMDAADVAEWTRRRPDAAEWCIRRYGLARVTELWKLYYFRNAIRLWTCHQVERWLPGTCSQTAADAAQELDFTAHLRQGRGYAPRPNFRDSRLDLIKAVGAPLPPFTFLDDFHLGGHLSYLHSLIDWAKQHGVELLLVDMPVSADLERLYSREYTAYREALADVERNRRVAVLRVSRSMVGLDDSSFADLIHLNLSGTRRLSSWLKDAVPAYMERSTPFSYSADSRESHRRTEGTLR
jgi:hypothetical protein